MSPWEIRLLKSDAIKFKSQVIEAEERIKKLEGLKLETELHYAREKKIMEDSLSQERARVCFCILKYILVLFKILIYFQILGW